jgi:hypothetical protein
VLTPPKVVVHKPRSLGATTACVTSTVYVDALGRAIVNFDTPMVPHPMNTLPASAPAAPTSPEVRSNKSPCGHGRSPKDQRGDRNARKAHGHRPQPRRPVVLATEVTPTVAVDSLERVIATYRARFAAPSGQRRRSVRRSFERAVWRASPDLPRPAHVFSPVDALAASDPGRP